MPNQPNREHRNAYMREYKKRKREEAKAREAAGNSHDIEQAEQTVQDEPPVPVMESEPIKVDALATQDDIAKEVVKKKRGNQAASLEVNFKGTSNDISQAIMNATRYIKAEPCKSDEEFGERIEAYFADCAQNGVIPRWETLALSLGITRQSAWNTATGKFGSPTRQRMLARAKDILSAIDAELVQTGKVNPVVYIFRAKNFYDMRDQQDVVITPNQPLGEQKTQEQLAEEYATLIELDDDE